MVTNEHVINNSMLYNELYDKEQKETRLVVDVNPELNGEQKSQVWKLIEEYGDIFSDVPLKLHY